MTREIKKILYLILQLFCLSQVKQAAPIPHANSCHFTTSHEPYTPKKDATNGAEDDITRFARSSVARPPRGYLLPTPFSLLTRTRVTSRLLTSLTRQKRTPQTASFFGAEDEIRTRATVSHTTPLAGEPLEPLGYFCMAHVFKSYITIAYFFALVKAF